MYYKISIILLISAICNLLFATAQPTNAQSINSQIKNDKLANVARQQLLNKISTARKALSVLENKIINKRQKFAEKLTKLEQNVIKLRKKTTVVRRLSDERTVSLTKLEQRLSTWQQQHVFQKNLLYRFLQQHRTIANFPTTAGIVDQLASVLIKSKQLSQKFSPNWQQSNVVLPNGEISQSPLLTIGPITWYWDEANQQAGFASLGEHGIWQHQGYLPNSDGIKQLQHSEVGNIVFDPTLRRALARSQHQESLIEHIIKGGLWVIPILLFALFSLTIALFKVIQLWRLPRFVPLSPVMVDKVLSKKLENSAVIHQIKGMQKSLLAIANNASSTTQRDDELFIQLQKDKYRLERRISVIAITAAVAPLLGLLGTVSGMIETFRMMTLFGSGDAEVVSGGISQALVTTELGLVVAIPALILNAVLSRKAKSYYIALENFAILLSKSNERIDEPYIINDLPDIVLDVRDSTIQGIVA